MYTNAKTPHSPPKGNGAGFSKRCLYSLLLLELFLVRILLGPRSLIAGWLVSPTALARALVVALLFWP
jgi:hypothetical protein